MSGEIKKTEKPELSEQDLDRVAGGTLRVRAPLFGHNAPKEPRIGVQPPPPAPKTPGTNSL